MRGVGQPTAAPHASVRRSVVNSCLKASQLSLRSINLSIFEAGDQTSEFVLGMPAEAMEML